MSIQNINNHQKSHAILHKIHHHGDAARTE